jgi:putative transposase
VDQDLLARNEFLAAENRILKVQLNGRLKLSDTERGMLGEIGHRLGHKALADVATIVRPDNHPGMVSQDCRSQVRWLEGA